MRALPGADPMPAELDARLRATLLRPEARAPRGRHREADGSPCFVNRLALASSPYLRQHAHNPVDWHPWGDEAFARARDRNRPVFLSIGYSTCHWCHVMEEESFEDEAIAALLNAHYVAVKVDREERPDVDAVYMRAAQRLTGAGGWPLSIWLTSEREPFFAGTYFPPYAGLRGAETGFFDLLTEIARLFHEDGDRVRTAARSLVLAIRAGAASEVATAGLFDQTHAIDLVAEAAAECSRGFDERYGGLRLSSKFPSHVPIRLLLRHHQRTGDDQALHMALRTLESMAAGGIYDHLAGGFHRYATDPAWLVPHFEKMLYDNALLIVAYTEAWQVSKRPAFARVVRETCEELLATFAAPEGGFYSATDADSEGEEGKYFVWSEDQIRTVLGPGEDTELFLHHYGIAAGSDSELGNVLHQAEPDEEITRRLGSARSRLAQARRSRVPPFRDEKILAAWNGLAISAFAIAGRVFAEARYVDAARRAAEFVLDRMLDPGGQLARSFCAGGLGVPGFLDDYACVAAGLLDLFESTHEARWFVEAQRLCDQVEARFADEPAGGWYRVGEEHERLLARERPGFDGAEPAGSSVALLNAARLLAYTDDQRWRQVTQRALACYRPWMAKHPLAMTEALLAVDYLAGPVREVVIAHPEGDPASARPFEQVLRDTFCPRKVLWVGAPESPEWLGVADRIPLLRDKVAQGGRATAYVCRQGQCDLPATDPEQFARQVSG